MSDDKYPIEVPTEVPIGVVEQPPVWIPSEDEGESRSSGDELPTATTALSRAFATGRLMDSLPGEIVVTLMAFVFAFLLGALLMVISSPGLSAGEAWAKVGLAYGSLVKGALWGPKAWAETAAQAAPLICAGLGVALAFRVGLFNIGGQGQAIWGAIAAGYVGFHYHWPVYIHLPAAILAGLVAGAIWAGIAGLLRAQFGAHEVIVTIMLNYVASNTLLWLLNGSLGDPARNAPISPPVDASAMLPSFYGRFHLGFILALLAAVVVWWILDRTRLGLSIRAVGANSDAAATAGMNVKLTLTLAMVIAGILCGLGGIMPILAPTALNTAPMLSVGLVGNIGFNAITVALLGRSRPIGVVAAGLLFGALQAGSLNMQAVAQTPAELANVIQAFIVMFVAAPMLVRTLAPFHKIKFGGKKRAAQAAPDMVSATVEAGVA